MKNDELEDILERFEYWKYVKMGGVLTNVLWEKSLDREQAIQALTSWKDKEVKKAQLGMIEYYDQVTNNKDMDWKGLFADNRKQIQYEIESLQSQGGK